MAHEIVSVPGLDLPRAAFELCLGLEARGATFRVTDGKLTLSGVKLTPEEMAAVRSYKLHIMAMIQYEILVRPIFDIASASAAVAE